MMILAATSSVGVGPWCFIKSKDSTAACQEMSAHLMLPSAAMLYGYPDLIFQQVLPFAKSSGTCFNDHGLTMTDWSVSSGYLSPTENLQSIAKRKMRDTRLIKGTSC